ncbi:MAG: EAL domain-containing protein [Burkholderiaceae bacterium]|nr:EAL domain-containing protein [Sulfuritalea sp.]MCF8175318.1 EAL domain-containing protein [Burkholderiaceae bacterium]MCF8183915.1 EAL domain-containing protein [Polynucleobacter sp.]
MPQTNRLSNDVMKRVQESGLNSRVARRILVLFLFAALVPTAGLAFYAYSQASAALTDLNYRRLRLDAKAAGLGLIQRLNWRADSLLRHANLLTPSTGIDPRLPFPRRLDGFRSLVIAGEQARAQLTPDQIDHLDKSKIVLQLSADSVPFMLAALEGTSSLLIAHLDKERLWSGIDSAEHYCVLTTTGSVLYCSPEMPAPRYENLSLDTEKNHRGEFSWQVNGEKQLASYWRAPLQANFASEGFIIVVSDDERDIQAVLTRFRQVFPAIIILALSLASWFAIGQIRRQMRPLERLHAGTRQLALGDFSSQVEVTGNDEFASLALSFNRMADSLNKKFHLLQALGELDHAILSSEDMDHIINLLLRHIPATVACDTAGVLHFREGHPPRFITLDADEAADAKSESEVNLESAEEQKWKDQPWLLVDLREPGAGFLSHFARGQSTHALIFPAKVGERLDSALVLICPEPPSDRNGIVQTARSLADRLSAAGSNIAWEGKLFHQAHFDALTDLPNRVLLRDRVEQAMLRATREGLSIAIMVVDLDDFKQVNDSLGHSIGDMLLVAVTDRLEQYARSTDTIARIGGDEFVILIPDLKNDSAVAIVDRIARTLCTGLARPLDVAGRLISSPASIGIALFPENADGFSDLLKAADAAMYESKKSQRGGYHFYSNQMNTDILARFELAQEIREAMEHGEFFLVYQPKISAISGEVVGAEALVRWASFKRGLVSPASFVPIVDEIGLGGRLGAWVLNTACAQMAVWQSICSESFAVSVNISPAQFQAGEIVNQVRDALTRNSLDPRRLELEVLESMAIDDSGNINTILAKLRATDVGIALDDFGTGYSSLVYLTQLPANILKIDRGFIVNLVADERQQAIVERIISLAKVLGFTVVAEGVEEDAQARMLATMGCDVFQGFLFSRPLTVRDFEDFIARRNGSTAVSTT